MKSISKYIPLALSAFLILSCSYKKSIYFSGNENIRIKDSDGHLFSNAVLNVCNDSLIILVSFKPYPITMKIKAGRESRHGDYVGNGEIIKSNDSMYYFNPIIYLKKDAKIKIDSLKIVRNEGKSVLFNFDKDTLTHQSEFRCSAYSCQENIYEPFIGYLDTNKTNDTLISHNFENGIRINLSDKIKSHTYISGATNGCRFEEVIKNEYALDKGRWRLFFYR